MPPVSANVSFWKSFSPAAYWRANADLSRGAAADLLQVHTTVSRITSDFHAERSSLLLRDRIPGLGRFTAIFRDNPFVSYLVSSAAVFGVGVFALTPASWGFAIVGFGALTYNALAPRFFSPWKTYRHAMAVERQRLLGVYTTFREGLTNFEAGDFNRAGDKVFQARQQFLEQVAITGLPYRLRQRSLDLIRDIEVLCYLVSARAILEQALRPSSEAQVRAQMAAPLIERLVPSYIEATTLMDACQRYRSSLMALAAAEALSDSQFESVFGRDRLEGIISRINAGVIGAQPGAVIDSLNNIGDLVAKCAALVVNAEQAFMASLPATEVELSEMPPAPPPVKRPNRLAVLVSLTESFWNSAQALLGRTENTADELRQGLLELRVAEQLIAIIDREYARQMADEFNEGLRQIIEPIHQPLAQRIAECEQSLASHPVAATEAQTTAAPSELEAWLKLFDRVKVIAERQMVSGGDLGRALAYLAAGNILSEVILRKYGQRLTLEQKAKLVVPDVADKIRAYKLQIKLETLIGIANYAYTEGERKMTPLGGRPVDHKAALAQFNIADVLMQRIRTDFRRSLTQEQKLDFDPRQDGARTSDGASAPNPASRAFKVKQRITECLAALKAAT